MPVLFRISMFHTTRMRDALCRVHNKINVVDQTVDCDRIITASHNIGYITANAIGKTLKQIIIMHEIYGFQYLFKCININIMDHHVVSNVTSRSIVSLFMKLMQHQITYIRKLFFVMGIPMAIYALHFTANKHLVSALINAFTYYFAFYMPLVYTSTS